MNMYLGRRKKWMAFVLSAVMMVTSVPAGTWTASAAESNGNLKEKESQMQLAEEDLDVSDPATATATAATPTSTPEIDWEGEYGIYNVDDLDVETPVTFHKASYYEYDTDRQELTVETYREPYSDGYVEYQWFAYSVDGDKKDLGRTSRTFQNAVLVQSFTEEESGATVNKQVDHYGCKVTLSNDDEVLKTAEKKFPVSYEPLTLTATRTSISLRENGKATLKVSARNYDAEYCNGGEFQWYRVTADGKEEELENETTDTLKVKVTDPTDSFKCVVTPQIRVDQDSSLKGVKLMPGSVNKIFEIVPMSGFRLLDKAPSAISAGLDEPIEFYVEAQVDQENGYTLSYQWEEHMYSEEEGKRVAKPIGNTARQTVQASEREDFNTVQNDYAVDDEGNFIYNDLLYSGRFRYKLTVSVFKDNEKKEEYYYYFYLREKASYTDNYYEDGLYETLYLQKGEKAELSLDSQTSNGYRAEKVWYQKIGEAKWYWESVVDEETGLYHQERKYLPAEDGFKAPELDGEEYFDIYNEYSPEWVDGHYVYLSRFYKRVQEGGSYVVSGDENIPGEYICRIFVYYKDGEEPSYTMDRVFKVEYQSELTAYAKDSEVRASLGASADMEIVAANRDQESYPITYTWSKLKTTTGEYEKLEQTGAVYHIDSVERSDFGTYQVLVEDGAEEKTITIVLSEEEIKIVKYTPQESNYRKSIGETIQLKADILFPEGVKPFYEWYRYEDYSVSEGDGAGQGQDEEYWELLNQDENYYNVNIASERDYTNYKCIVSYKNRNTVYSQVFIYHVMHPYTVELERMTPRSQIKKLGDSITYRVRMITDDPNQNTYKYQWYRMEDTGRVDIEGATSPEYTISSLKMEDFTWLYCAVSRDEEDAEDEEVLSTVDFNTSFYTTAYLEKSSETKQVKLGSDVTMGPVILKGESYNFTYQWYRDQSVLDYYDNWEKIHGAAKASFTLNNLGSNELTRYRCDIQLDGADVMTYYVTLQEDDTKAGITVEPEYDEDQSLIAMETVLGRSAKMEIQAESEDDLELKYQWYFRDEYSSWEAIGDATTPSYSIDIVTSACLGYYRCVVTDTEGTQADRVFSLRATTNMEVTSDALYVSDMLGYEVTLGGNVTLTASATIDSDYNLYYRWYHYVEDQEKGVRQRELLYGQEEAFLKLNNIQEKDLGIYACEISDAKGNTQNLNYLVYFDTGLNVVPGVRYPGMRADGTVRMYVNATANQGETITYQWSKWEEVEDEDGESGYEYVDIKNAASNEFIVTKLTEDTAGKYCLTVKTRGEIYLSYYEITQEFLMHANRVWAEQGDEIEITQQFINPYADEEYTYEWYQQEQTTGTMHRVAGVNGSVLRTTAPKYNLSDTFQAENNGYKTVNYTCVIKKKGEKEGEEEMVSRTTIGVNVLPQVNYNLADFPETNHPNDQRFSVLGYQIAGAKQVKITFDKQTDLGSAQLLLIDGEGEAVWHITEDASQESEYYVDGDKVIFLMINSENTDLSYGYKTASIEEMKEPVVVDNSCKCQPADQIIAAALEAMKANSLVATGGAVSGPAVKSTKAVPKKGSKKTVKKITYRVTKSAKKNGTVAVASVHKSLKKVNLGAAVKLNGYTFKITAIDKKAFGKAANLSSVTIGKNVKSIGASAFVGRKKLKKIAIKATGLKSIGKKAFSKVPKKAVATVPKKQKKAYKKLLKKAGFKGKVK